MHPKGIDSSMIGLTKTARGAARPVAGRVPGEAALPPRAAVSAYGLVLLVAAVAPPVAAAFSGFAYLRVLAAHRRRVARELARLPKRPEGRQGEYGRKSSRPALPAELGRTWDDIRLVNCARCRRVLLGESDEYVRGLSRSKRLPPPVAARVSGRPVCGACLGVGHAGSETEAERAGGRRRGRHGRRPDRRPD